MLDRFIYDLSLFVNFLHIVHHVFNTCPLFVRILQQPNLLEMAHLIHEILPLNYRINHNP